MNTVSGGQQFAGWVFDVLLLEYQYRRDREMCGEYTSASSSGCSALPLSPSLPVPISRGRCSASSSALPFHCPFPSHLPFLFFLFPRLALLSRSRSHSHSRFPCPCRLGHPYFYRPATTSGSDSHFPRMAPCSWLQ